MTLTQERQQILDAIGTGYTNAPQIAAQIGKKTKTISKLLYLMKKSGLVSSMAYGHFAITETSIDNIEGRLDKMSLSLTKAKEDLEYLEQENCNLQNEIIALNNRLDDKQNDQYELYEYLYEMRLLWLDAVLKRPHYK